MDRCVVVVISNNKARFFTLEQAEWPEYESGPNLVERESLSPSVPNCSYKFWSNFTSRNDRDAQKIAQHNYKFERKFAQKIVIQIVTLIRVTQSPKLVIVAPSSILATIRKLFLPTLFENLHIKEIHKDISHFTCDRIHKYLAQKQIIPACEKVVYPR